MSNKLNVPFGIPEQLPDPASIGNLPEGARRVKLCFRNDEFPKAFVRVGNGIRKFILCKTEAGWEVGTELEQAANLRHKLC